MAGQGNELRRVLITPIDIVQPTIKLDWSNRTQTRTDLSVTINSTEVLLFSNLTVSNGQTIIRLTSAQRSTVLAAMSTVQEQEATFTLKTYSSPSGADLMGTSSLDSTWKTSYELSGPTFTSFSYTDISAAATFTGTDQLVQNLSALTISISAATAKNEASIVRYVAKLGTYERSINAPNTQILGFNDITLSGTAELSVSAIDSRGYVTTVTKTVDIIPYYPIELTSYQWRRVNNVEVSTNLKFSGNFTQITVDNVDQNYFDSAEYRWKEEPSGSWSNYTDFTNVVVSGSTFSFEATPWSYWNTSKSYTLEITVYDRFGSNTVTLLLPKATPLMSFRPTGVGINRSNPTRMLDVIGNIGMNDINVMGLVRALSSADDLNTITAQGIYIRFDDTGHSNLNYPGTMRGVLEVIGTEADVLQRFTDIDNLHVYIRSRYTSGMTHYWRNWTQI